VSVTFRPRVALTIYRKEVRETLRDRRTLVVMILLPLTLYPLLTILFASLAASQKREEHDRPSQICVIGSAGGGLRKALVAEEKIVLAPRSCTREDLKTREVGAVLELEPGFEAGLSSPTPTRATVYFDETEEASRLAADRVAKSLSAYVQRRREGVLESRGLPKALVGDAPIDRKSVTSARENGAAILAKFLPMLVIFMVVLGAFYPAVDLTAGERERGTLETLLVAPIERIEVIVGKWLATATMAAITGLLNLGSMGMTVGQMLRLADGGDTITVPWSAVAMSGLAVVPSALFYSAIFMAVASLARTYKEAQSMVMPVYLGVSLPATFAVMPGAELTLGNALVPGTGVALFVKGIIQGRLPIVPAVTALVAMLAYAGCALAFAARIYTNEETLFAGDAEKPVTRRRRLFAAFAKRDRSLVSLRPAPSPAEAMTLFSIVILLLFFVATPLQKHDLVSGLLLTEWVLLLGLTLLFLRSRGVDLRSALRLERPTGRSITAALLLGLSAWLLVNTAVERLLPVRELSEEMKQTLMASRRSLGFNLFFIAATPAVCEELLFRGAILSGLRRGLKPLSAVICCGILFGLFHLHFLRLVPTALLGMVMAYLALEGRSIVPAMIFHFLNNGSAVVVTHFGWDEALSLSTRTGRIALGAACVAFVLGLFILRGRRPSAPAATVET
jgi:sodium transport system permease protein